MDKIIQFPKRTEERFFREELPSRELTLYNVAKNADERALDEIMFMHLDGDHVVGEGVDEFGKSLFDYAVHFNQADFIIHMSEKGYLRKMTYDPNYYYLLTGHAKLDYVVKLLELAIKKDNVKLFSLAIKRMYAIFDIAEGGAGSEEGYDLDARLIDKILHTREILFYLTRTYVDSQEFAYVNFKAFSADVPCAIKKEDWQKTPNISASAKLLLNRALESKNLLASAGVLARSMQHNMHVWGVIREKYKTGEFVLKGDSAIVYPCPSTGQEVFIARIVPLPQREKVVGVGYEKLTEAYDEFARAMNQIGLVPKGAAENEPKKPAKKKTPAKKVPDDKKAENCTQKKASATKKMPPKTAKPSAKKKE